MSGWAIVGLSLAAAAVIAIGYALVLWPPGPARATLSNFHDDTSMDEGGVVRSVQGADLTIATSELDAIWTAEHLERLARTYWRFLSRATFGLVRVAYTPAERFVVLIARPLVLLRFQAPEYALDAECGLVRWRIERGILVSRRGRGGNGYLQIDVRRREPDAAGMVTVHVEVAVANFYPAISAISRVVYTSTQSRIHVIVTRAFLRSLARLDLAESRTGRFRVPAVPVSRCRR
jgi:hypothetical protein